MGSGNSTPSTCTSCADSALSITGNIIGILTLAYALLAGLWVYSSSQARAWTDFLGDLTRRLANTLQFLLANIAPTSLIRRAYDGDLKDLLADGSAWESHTCYEGILSHAQEFWRSLPEVGLVDSTSVELISKLDQPGAPEHIMGAIQLAVSTMTTAALGNVESNEYRVSDGDFKPKVALWYGVLLLFLPDFRGWRIRARYVRLRKAFNQHLAHQEKLKAQVLAIEQRIQMILQERKHEKLQNLERICQNIASELALLKNHSETATEP